MEILVSPGTIMPRVCDECPQDEYCSTDCTLCADWCKTDFDVCVHDNGGCGIHIG